MRKLGGQFINGVSYMTGKTKAAATVIGSKTTSAKNAHRIRSVESKATRTGQPQTLRYQNKAGTANVTHTATPTKSRSATVNGATYEPQIKVTRVSHPANSGKDKTS